ncbi:MAG: hypothetical protein WCT19_02360 [Candidatus Paceibacterota bacterium]
MFKSLKITSCVKISAILLCVFGLVGIVSAQMPDIGGIGGGDTLQVTIIPAHPGPGDQVSIQLEDYSTDLNKASISWFLGTKLSKSGTGQKTFSFTMGNAGSVSTVTILAKTAEGQTLQKIIPLRPAEVDLIWEAQSYTPPFYEGKALFPYQGVVKVVAIPHFTDQNGNELKATTVTYKWTKDGNTVSSMSGYGKNTYYFIGGIPLRPVTIDVEATSEDQKFAAVKSITVSPIKPMVRFYENNPVAGILWGSALQNNFLLNNEEVQISAIPYYFDVASRNDFALNYEWSMNGSPVPNANSNSDIVFRQPGDIQGSTIVGLQVSNSNQDKIFQFGANNVSIVFSGVGKAPGFGN